MDESIRKSLERPSYQSWMRATMPCRTITSFWSVPAIPIGKPRMNSSLPSLKSLDRRSSLVAACGRSVRNRSGARPSGIWMASIGKTARIDVRIRVQHPGKGPRAARDRQDLRAFAGGSTESDPHLALALDNGAVGNDEDPVGDPAWLGGILDSRKEKPLRSSVYRRRQRYPEHPRRQPCR